MGTTKELKGVQEYEEKSNSWSMCSNELLPSTHPDGWERRLQIVELIRNRLRNGEENKRTPTLKISPTQKRKRANSASRTGTFLLKTEPANHRPLGQSSRTGRHLLYLEMGLSRALPHSTTRMSHDQHMGANVTSINSAWKRPSNWSQPPVSPLQNSGKIGFTTSRYFRYFIQAICRRSADSV